MCHGTYLAFLFAGSATRDQVANLFNLANVRQAPLWVPAREAVAGISQCACPRNPTGVQAIDRQTPAPKRATLLIYGSARARTPLEESQ